MPFLPLLPIQVLLNDFIYDMSQLSLSFDGIDRQDTHSPQHWDMRFLKKFMFVFGPLSSVFDILTFVILLKIFHAQPAMFQTGWFVESLITQSMIVLVIRTRKVPFWTSRPAVIVVAAAGIAVALALALGFSPIGQPFQFAPLPFAYLGFLTAIVGAYIVTTEIVKNGFLGS